MATFTTNSDQAVSFGSFDIDALGGSYTYIASAATWRRGPTAADTGTHVEFTGTGFAYFAGALSGGTINGITSRDGGAVDFAITGMSMSGTSFTAYQDTGDSLGFLTEVFSGNDTITGSELADQLIGFAGNDVIEGAGGNDILDGRDGYDTLLGGDGNDKYVIDADDTIVETGKSLGDTVIAWSTSVDLSLAAYDGIENVELNGKMDLAATGDTASNRLLGNYGANALTGGGGDDKLEGFDGNDTLDGGTGADALFGGFGDDGYYVDSSGDQVTETYDAGWDTVFSSLTSYTLGFEVENLTLIGSGKNATGNTSNNILTGNAAANTLDGKGGSDTLIGGDGNDSYRVDSIQDKVIETLSGGTSDAVNASITYKLPEHVERLYLLGSNGIGGSGNDAANMIAGNGGANKLSGGGGDDDLYGGAGDDILIGGEGNDDLHGGAGSDTCDVGVGDDTVHYASKGGVDVISGFDGNATGGQDKFDMVSYFDILDVAPGDRDERIHVSKNGTTVNVWVDHDGNGSFDFQVAQISTADAITVGQDIIVL